MSLPLLSSLKKHPLIRLKFQFMGCNKINKGQHMTMYFQPHLVASKESEDTKYGLKTGTQ